MTGEFSAIERLRRMLPFPVPPGQTWIGDDAAVVEVPTSGRLLLAADAVVAGVHSDLSLTGLDDLGWKAMAANVSDLAAMGGRPCHALVSVAGPADTDLDRLYAGIIEAAVAYRCPVVGGDLSNSPVLVVSVAVTGTTDRPPVLRSGARPGDGLWVTGPLGASAAGLRLLRQARQAGKQATGPLPAAHARPRALPEAGAAASAAGASAMIDVSDGFTADLDHLATASGVGVELATVPVMEGATESEALGGGEDYVLVFAAPDAARVREAFTGLPQPILIGTCTGDPTERTLGGGPLPVAGWQHDWT